MIAVLTSAWASLAAGGEMRTQKDGIILRVRAVPDAVVFCFNAEGALKIASDYGIQFKVVRNDRHLWNEVFPKTITGPGWYFNLPLGLELRTRGDVQRRRIDVDLGACSEATLCNPVNFQITLPSYDVGRQAAALCSE
jgi:hypothetical protein